MNNGRRMKSWLVFREESKDRHTVRREKNELLGRALFCNVIHAGWCTLALPPHPLSIREHLVEP